MKFLKESVTARIEAKRERHRQRNFLVRGLLLVAGSVLAIISAILVLPLPELGVPGLLFGLGFLALEFDWALRWLQKVEAFLRRIFDRRKK